MVAAGIQQHTGTEYHEARPKCAHHQTDPPSVLRRQSPEHRACAFARVVQLYPSLRLGDSAKPILYSALAPRPPGRPSGVQVGQTADLVTRPRPSSASQDPQTFSSRCSRSHELMTCANVSYSASLTAV